MSYGKRVTDFLRSRIGNLGICSLVLVVLEKMMDNDFVCPCQFAYNIAICVLYITVPSFVCFTFTFCFVGTEAEGPEDKECEAEGPRDKECEAEGPGDKGNHSTCSKVRYALFIVCIWLFIFFVDGRYVSCACSHWGGEYTETGALKWCKPNGSETVVFERLQKTQRCITISQFAGFSTAFVTVGVAIICFRNDKYCKKGQDYKQAKGETV